MQGKLSQIFNLGPRFDFIGCIIFVLKKVQQVTRFLT